MEKVSQLSQSEIKGWNQRISTLRSFCLPAIILPEDKRTLEYQELEEKYQHLRTIFRKAIWISKEACYR